MIWYILGIIALIILIILFTPLRLKLSYDKTLSAVIYIGFFKKTLFPKKEKKKTKKKAADKKPQQKKTEEKEKPKFDISKILGIIKDVQKLVTDVLKDFFKHLVINKLEISIIVATDNAADTAVNYGKCCSVVYPAISAVSSVSKCKKCSVDINPNFDEKEQTKFFAELITTTKIIWLVTLVLKHGIKGLKLLLSLNKKGE